MKTIMTIVIALAITVVSFAQQPANWITTGNSTFNSQSPYIGTNVQLPFRIFTNGIHRASFTYDGTEYADGSILAANGLRIFNQTNPNNPIGVLDLLTSGQNRTHVGFGRNGTITGAGTANRMEYYAHDFGFWFNAMDGQSRVIWTRGGTENARMGINTFWRFGLNSGNADAARRVEIVDANQQLRLSQATGAGFAEFYVRPNGRLLITPSGSNTGFTNTNDLNYNPTERIDVNGSARFRIVANGPGNCLLIGANNSGPGDVTVRRLDFTGNPNQVLLGNGTWGVASSLNNAHNGLSISSIDVTKVAFGQDVFQAFDPAELLSNREVPLNKKYVHFSDKNIGDVGYFAIGSSLVPSDKIKFSLYNDTLKVSQQIRTRSLTNTPTNDRTSLIATTEHGITLTGVYGQTIGAKTISYGIRGRSISDEILVQSIGGNFEGLGLNYLENNGVRGFAKNSVKLNIGGKFKGTNDDPSVSSHNIGVYGEADGINSQAGYFVGNVITTGASLWFSDSTYKDSIVTITDDLDSLFAQLHPVSFKFNEEAQANFNTGSDMKLGFLAQEVGAVYPWLVKDVVLPAEFDTTGVEIRAVSTYKAVDVTQLIPLLVSVQQKSLTRIEELTAQNNTQQTAIENLTMENATQQATIDNLTNRLTQLENCLAGILPSLCQMSQSMIEATTPQEQEAVRNQLQVELSNHSSIVLNQNVPNPFAEQTTIHFSIPSSVLKAQIHFYDGNGKLIQSVDVKERGLGSLSVFGSDLSSGTYTYTLVADGVVVATKKMMKQ